MEPVKPISGQPAKETNSPKPEESKKVKIGNVEFRKDQIDADKTKTYVKNGKKMNSVMVKPGVQIDFPDQSKPAKVESLGLSEKWYVYDTSNIHIENLDNATIYGAKNRTDYINLEGTSSNNKIYVNQEESWYVNGDVQRDHVELGFDTKNNKVYMDEKDKLEIDHYVYDGRDDNGKEKSDIDILEVEGEGMSAQEAQLKGYLPQSRYKYHKSHQEK